MNMVQSTPMQELIFAINHENGSKYTIAKLLSLGNNNYLSENQFVN